MSGEYAHSILPDSIKLEHWGIGGNVLQEGRYPGLHSFCVYFCTPIQLLAVRSPDPRGPINSRSKCWGELQLSFVYITTLRIFSIDNSVSQRLLLR